MLIRTTTRRTPGAHDASRIPVLVGGAAADETLLQQLRERLGRTSARTRRQRTATTPERFLRAIVASSPFPVSEPGWPIVRARFHALSAARNGSGEPVNVLPRRVSRCAHVRKLPDLPASCTTSSTALGQRQPLRSPALRGARCAVGRPVVAIEVTITRVDRRRHARHARPAERYPARGTPEPRGDGEGDNDVPTPGATVQAPADDVRARFADGSPCASTVADPPRPDRRGSMGPEGRLSKHCSLRAPLPSGAWLRRAKAIWRFWGRRRLTLTGSTRLQRTPGSTKTISFGRWTSSRYSMLQLHRPAVRRLGASPPRNRSNTDLLARCTATRRLAPRTHRQAAA